MAEQITPLHNWIKHKLGIQGELTRAALDAYQLGKIQEIIAFTRQNSSFYRNKFSQITSLPQTFLELEQFPFTTAQELRESGLQMLCVSQDDINRVVTLETSGTSGEPKRLFFTQSDQELTVDFFKVGMSTFTANADRVLILLPCDRPGSVGDLLAIALEQMGAIPFKYGIVTNPAQVIDIIKTRYINVIVGIPIQILQLARLDNTLRVKSVLLSTDHVANAIVNIIEESWHCRVFNHYGMTEMGLGGGVECEAHRGYHLREADLYFEIINPLTGEPVPPGTSGEVVFTTLTRQGMPLIRYRTGDLSQFLPGECPCGTVLRTMAKVRSRFEGQVYLGDNGFFTLSDLEELVFTVAGVLDFAAVWHKSERTLTLNLKVIPGDEQNSVQQVLQRFVTDTQFAPLLDEHLLELQVHLNNSATPTTPLVKRTIDQIA